VLQILDAGFRSSQSQLRRGTSEGALYAFVPAFIRAGVATGKGSVIGLKAHSPPSNYCPRSSQ
jgi:hypothetical protein